MRLTLTGNHGEITPTPTAGKTIMTHARQWRSKTSAGALMAATALVAAHAFAQQQYQIQYIWIDDHGIRHFSDRPPAPSVPQKRRLKDADSRTTIGSPTALQMPAPHQQPTEPSGIAARNADFIKRRAKVALAEQQSAQEDEQRAALARNCAAALENQRLLESSGPVGTIAPDGSRAVLGAEARVLASKRNRDALAHCR
jgi:hypothetical protein